MWLLLYLWAVDHTVLLPHVTDLFNLIQGKQIYYKSVRQCGLGRQKRIFLLLMLLLLFYSHEFTWHEFVWSSKSPVKNISPALEKAQLEQSLQLPLLSTNRVFYEETSRHTVQVKVYFLSIIVMTKKSQNLMHSDIIVTK